MYNIKEIITSILEDCGFGKEGLTFGFVDFSNDSRLWMQVETKDGPIAQVWTLSIMTIKEFYSSIEYLQDEYLIANA